MWGAEGLTRAGVINLRASLPRQTEAIRQQRELTVEELPDVAKIYPTPREFVSVEGYPCIMLAPQDTDGRLENRQTKATGTYDEYSYLYRLRALVYVMAPGYDTAELLAQRTLLAVRMALLSDKVYGDPDNGAGAVLDARLLREAYAEPSGVPNRGGFIAGGWVEIGVRSTERLETNLPNRDNAEIGVGAKPIHPAMLGEPGQ